MSSNTNSNNLNLYKQKRRVPDQNVVYSFGAQVGKGGYADVYKVQSNNSSVIYACKAIPKSQLTTDSKKEKVRSEISIHKEIDHQNIVTFLNSFEDRDFIFIVLEYCEHRSMSMLLRHRTTLTDPEVRYFLVQIISALEYLHGRRIIHRDLKAANVLLHGKAHIICKLCDFGLSTELSHDDERRKTMCGTPNYIAPEILENAGHSYEADIWSLACLMYALLVGKPPFQTKPIREIYKKVMNANYVIPKDMHPLARDLIHSTLIIDPQQRPRLDRFKSHIYFGEYIPEVLDHEILKSIPVCVQNYIKETKSKADSHEKRCSLTTSGIYSMPERQKAVYHQYQLTGRDGSSSGPHSFEGSQRNSQSSPSYSLKSSVTLNYQKLDSDSNALVELIQRCIDNCKEVDTMNTLVDTISMIWAIKWVDYSDSNHGFGYQLSDTSYGVIMKDFNKILLLPDNHTKLYMTLHNEEGHNGSHRGIRLTNEINAAKTRLDIFVSYMNEHLHGYEMKEMKQRILSERKDNQRQPFLLAWTRGWEQGQEEKEFLIIMRISPCVMQINFEDHSKLAIDYNSNDPKIMYIQNVEGEGQSMKILTTLSKLMDQGITSDLRNKLRIAAKNFSKISYSESLY